MLNLLKWDKPIRVNGEVFSNSEEAYEKFKDYEGGVKIEINFIDTTKHREVGDIELKDGIYYF